MKPCNVTNKNNLNSQLESKVNTIGRKLGVTPEVIKRKTETEVNFRPKSNRYKSSAYRAAMIVWSSLNKKWPGTVNKPRTRNDNSATFTVPMNDSQFAKMANMENDDPVLYQLTPEQSTARNYKLEEELINLLEKNQIQLQSFDEYKKMYKARKNIEMDILGLADIQNRVIAWSKDEADGKTLPEEVGHFLESMLKSNDQDSWKRLMNARDNRNVLLIEQTKTWKDNYARYLKIYNNDTNLAKREIVGKLFGEFITQKFNQDQYKGSPKVIQWLLKAIDWVQNKFKRNDVATLPNIVSDIFEGEVALLFEGRQIKTKEEILFSGEIDLENAASSILDVGLNVLNNRVKQIKIERNRLKGNLRKRYNDLKSRHDINSLFETIDIFEKKSVKTEDDLNALDELYELVKLDFLREKELKDIKKLKDLTKQLNTIEKLIVTKQEGLALTYFISGVPKKGGKTTEGGLKNDIIEVLKVKSQIDNGEIELTPELFGELSDFKEYYTPVIEKIKAFHDKKGKFDGVNNKKFKKDVKLLFGQLNEVNNFLNNEQKAQTVKFLDSVNTNPDGSKIDPDFNPERAVRDGMYYDITKFVRFTGAAQHVSNPLVQAYIKMVSDIQTTVYSRTYNKGIEILSQVQALKKKINKKDVEKSLAERDSKGNTTGYLANNYVLGGEDGFLTVKEREHEAILDRVEAKAKSLGLDIFLARGEENYQKRRATFIGHDILAQGLPRNEQKTQIKAMREVYKFYRKEIFAWERANTKPIIIDNAQEKAKAAFTKEEYDKALQKYNLAVENPFNQFSWSVELIVQQRRTEMSQLEFNDWLDRNIKTDLMGIDHYTGELITPADKYINKEYQKLKQNKDWVELSELYADSLRQANNNLPQFYSNTYANKYLLPQISRSSLDTLIASKSYFSKFSEFKKGIKDIVSSGVKLKEDDNIYSTDYEIIKGDSSIYRNAPIRYNKLLSDPTLLSEDVFSSLILYIEMSENFVEKNAALKTVDFIRTGVKSTTLKKSFQSGETKGLDTETLKFMNDLIDTQIYGETSKPKTIKIGDNEYDVNKMSQKMAKWIRDKNLLGNFPAIFTNFVQAYAKENVIEKLIGVSTTLESSRFARRELMKNAGKIMSEMENPVKTNKVNIFIDKVGLQSNRERFTNLDKSSFLRRAMRIGYYGLWAASDFVPKAEAYIASADNYRFIDNKWYTKKSFKGTNEEWKANAENSFYRLLEVKDNNLSSPKITQDQWNVVIKKAKRLASNLDTQPMDIDGANVNRNFWGQFLTLHRSWMFQGVQRRFKRGHFNYITEENELGYYHGAWSALRNMILTKQLLTDVQGTFQRWDQLSPVEKEGALRTAYDVMALYAAYLMAFIINGIAADDEDNPLMQLAAYISTRLVVENMAFLSASEFLDIANRPVAGIDFARSLSDMFDQTIAMLNFWDETETKVVRSGPYKDMTHLQRNIIKSLPWIKGYYETFPIDTPLSNPATATESKNRFIKNKVITTSPVNIIAPIQAILGDLKDAGKED